jgi:hypothetical protein
MKPILLCIIFLLSGILLAADSSAPPVAYGSQFDKTEVGKVPEDVMVLDGTFAIREFQGKKCLELAPDPIGSFGALVGPEGLTAMDVQARIWGAPTGKRFPELGIGANDAGGYKLFLVPQRHVLELRKGDEAVASIPFEWSGATWTWFRLRVESADQKTWTIQGKAWAQGQKEPQGWMLTQQDAEAPSAGKASIWGNDFSEQPIRFDDVTVTPVK